MSDLEPVFREMIDTLSQAQRPVQDELAQLSRSGTKETEHLWRLARSVGDFSAQADALLVMMLERGAPNDLVDTAETLVDFFQDAKAQVDVLLKAGRGPAETGRPR